MIFLQRPLIALCALMASSALFAADVAPAPRMVAIPASKISTFTCAPGLPLCAYKDYVEREVMVAAFEMAANEVTFAEWDACVADNACAIAADDWEYKKRRVRPPCVANQPCNLPFDEGWGRGTRPVIDVSWDEVQQYLAWLNKKTGQKYRLPTAQEWELAASGGTTTTFAWGNKLGKNNANCDGCGSKWDNKQTAPVASFKPNKFGLYDMTGNVQEWLSTCFPSRDPADKQCNSYMYRGGAWSTKAKTVEPGYFFDAFPNQRGNSLGFRLAR